MARNAYWPGALVTVQGFFQTTAIPPVAADPVGAITLTYEGPADIKSTVAQGSLTKKSTGLWTYQIDTSALPAGVYAYRFVAGPGTGQSAGENQFIVNTTLVP